MFRAFLSLFTALFALAVLAAGAYGAFSGSATSLNQSFNSGILALNSTGGSWVENIADKMSPGDTIHYVVTVANTGTVPMKLLNTSSESVSGELAGATTTTLSPVGGWGTTILPSATQDVTVALTLNAAADNSYMDKSGSVAATFFAESTAR